MACKPGVGLVHCVPYFFANVQTVIRESRKNDLKQELMEHLKNDDWDAFEQAWEEEKQYRTAGAMYDNFKLYIQEHMGEQGARIIAALEDRPVKQKKRKIEKETPREDESV